MLIIPIRTESDVRRTPYVNYALIAANVLVFLVLNQPVGRSLLASFEIDYLVFSSHRPAFYQFFTYQFLHADIMHLLGNMVFLWVFGNSVNAKMGDVPYLLFYLAGGVIAACGYALVTPGPSHLLGASGAIAAVTTAYLALFPRSHVTVLVWFFLFIHFFSLPAMIIIGVKIIVWDNIIAPSIGQQDAVAHSAHLAGYLFGFTAALAMLLIRALPRDQFDILALWKRWHLRREFAAAMADPRAAARAQYGSAARIPPQDPAQRAKEDEWLDRITGLRSRIAEQLEAGDPGTAASLYGELIRLDARQCLAERHQLAVAREFYRTGRFELAADAFERFVECYANARDADDVRLLLGIICARDLNRFEAADRHLTRSMESLRDPVRRDQCYHWLKNVREALGLPAPDPA